MRFSVFKPAGSGIEAGIAVIQMTVIQRLREGPAFSYGQLVKRGSLEIETDTLPERTHGRLHRIVERDNLVETADDEYFHDARLQGTRRHVGTLTLQVFGNQ